MRGGSGRLKEHLLGPDEPGRVASPGAWLDRPVGGMSVHFACPVIVLRILSGPGVRASAGAPAGWP